MALDEERIILFTVSAFLTGYKNGSQKWFREENFLMYFVFISHFLDSAWISSYMQ